MGSRAGGEALDIVTGRKQSAMDLDVPGALPTMVCRPPTINGTALAVKNLSQVKAMPGVIDVAIIPHTPFVAGRGRGAGGDVRPVHRCDPGARRRVGRRIGGRQVRRRRARRKAELPLTPALPLGKTLDQRFTFYFRPGDPLETNCAVADVRGGEAQIWASLKSPIWAKEQIATNLGLPLNNVTVHVAQGGGSFGRHLFADNAFEAAAISQKLGKCLQRSTVGSTTPTRDHA